MTLLYIYLFGFSICLQEGIWVCIILPSHIHTHTVCMTWVGPYTRVWVTLELEEIV